MRGPAPKGIATRLDELADKPSSQRSGRKAAACAKWRSSTAAGRMRHITRAPAGNATPPTAVSCTAC